MDKVVSAGIDGFVTGKGFFEGGKTSPGVGRVETVWGGGRNRGGGGDAPEVKSGLSLLGGVEDKLNGKDAGGVEAATEVGLGALEVVSGGGIVKDETSGDDLGLMFDEVKGGERLGELGLQIML